MKSIAADLWNNLIAFVRRNQVLGVTVLKSGTWRHPWQITPQWNAQQQQWEALIEPGFVNGLDATVQLDAQQAPVETLARLQMKAPSGSVDAWLTESPNLPLSDWRSIGPDATPTGESDGADGSVNFTYEPVPKFFTALGVGAPPKVGGIDSIVQSMSGTSADQASVCLLRAMDLVLYQDRPATASQFSTSNGIDGTIFQYDVTVVNAPNARTRAYLRPTSKYVPPPPPSDPLSRLMGDWSDTPRDELWMASLYLVSPPGTGFGSPVDGSWQPYVQHRVFWNLLHATNALPPPLKSDNLTLNTGLAGGVGDPINQFLLSQVNDANSAVAQFLGRNTIDGMFWSV